MQIRHLKVFHRITPFLLLSFFLKGNVYLKTDFKYTYLKIGLVIKVFHTNLIRKKIIS